MKKLTLLFSIVCLSVTLLSAQDNASFMLDSSFNFNGKSVIKQVTTNQYTLAEVKSLVLPGDGTIIAGGDVKTINGQQDYFLTRYLPNGKLDVSFGNNGIVYTNNKLYDFFSEMKKQSSGNLVVVGESFSNGPVTYQLNRYSANGTFDSSFGSKGWVVLPNLNSTIVIQPDDKIVVCGLDFSKSSSVTARRFLKNGMVDSSFGKNGLTVITLEEKPRYTYRDPRAALDNKGRVIVGLTYIFEKLKTNNVVVIRLTNSGQTDSTFNKQGIAVGSYLNPTCVVDAVAVQANNKIVVGGGTSGATPVDDFFLSRFNEDGLEDKGFGDNGAVTTDFTPPGYEYFDDYIRGLSIQDDGKIIAVGASDVLPYQGKIAIARYLPTGGLDSSFGMGGKTYTSVLNGDTRAYSVAIQPNGKILAGGYSRKDKNGGGNGGEVVVVRYLKEKKQALPGIVSKTANSIAFEKKAITIYPNPATNIITVKGLENKPYQIVNSAGKIIMKGILNDSHISIAGFASGLYYLQPDGNQLLKIAFIKK